MYFIIANAVDLDKAVQFLAVIAVITQRVEDLSERDMRQVFRDVLRFHADPPKFDDRANPRLRVPNHGFTVKFRVRNNVWMLCCLDHLLPFITLRILNFPDLAVAVMENGVAARPE